MMETESQVPLLQEPPASQASSWSFSFVTKATLVSLGICLASAVVRGGISTSKLIKLQQYDTAGRLPDRNERVVIIGGGAAGTYAAWRLANARDSVYAATDIHLYERSDHISGRLFSPTIGTELCAASEEDPDMSHLPRTELGGMRLMTTHHIVMGVLDELGVQTGPFYMNADDETPVIPKTNPLFARNVLGMRVDFKNEENKVVNEIPFTTDAQKFDEDGPYTPKYPGFPDKPILNASEYDPCDGDANKEVFEEPYGPHGEPMYTFGLWEMLRSNVGVYGDQHRFDEAVDGYAIASEDIGLASPEFAGVLPKENSNSAFVRPLNGMETIPRTLNDAATKLGVSSTLNQEVTKIQEKNNGKWHVTLRETVTSTCTGITTIRTDIAEKVVEADRVILALPAAALKRIEFDSASQTLDLTVKKLVDEVVGLKLMKLFAAWPFRWWNTVDNLDTFYPKEDKKDPDLKVGRSTTFTAGMFTNDITSHIYSWYPGTQSRPETVAEKAAACEDMGVIQLYVMPNRLQRYISSSQIREQENCAHDDDNCNACNVETDDAWFKPAISTRLQKLLSLDLSTIFRYEVPNASDIMYRIWTGDDPVTRSDGVHFWKSGVKWWERYHDALQPMGQGSTIHLIGETFSHHQGWTEGALETAEHLMQEVLGIAAPNWLARQDYCKSNPFYAGRHGGGAGEGRGQGRGGKAITHARGKGPPCNEWFWDKSCDDEATG